MKLTNIYDQSDRFGIILNISIILAQIVVAQSAPKFFSTPLCKHRYQKEAVFTERCLVYRLFSLPKQQMKGICRKIYDLAKKPTAFFVRSRGPPSEI